jgi:hypothetical protein
MRKFGIKYSASHPQGLEVRDQFARVKNFEQWKEVLDRYYAEDLPGVYPSRSLYEQEQECG